MAPKLPMRESFMMVRICAFSQPPPKPSTVSPQPSSWKAPVMYRVAAIEARMARVFGQMKKNSPKTRAPMPPTISPTAGK